MKIKNISTKLLTIILSILMVTSIFPMSIFAEIIDTDNDGVTVIKNNSEFLSGKKDVCEVTELREETVKHFKLEDGSFAAVQYNVPVHYADENGKWQDIDNSLAENGNEYSTKNAKIKFAKKVTGNKSLFTLHNGNSKITISLNDAKKKTLGKVTNNHTEFDGNETKLQKMMTLDKLSSEIIYSDILDGVDLEYIIQSGSIKENIIVKQESESYIYTFTLELNNLTPILNEDGSITLNKKDGSTVYTIPKGYMYDSNEEISDAIIYDLQQIGNNKYSFIIEADKSWINSPERKFPIVIDPPISPSISQVSSLFIDKNSPDSAKYLPYLSVGNNTVSYWKATTLPELPKSAYITNATISLKYQSGSSNYIEANYVTSDWDRSLTWNKTITDPKQGMIYKGEPFDCNYVDSSRSDKWFSWNITNRARQWYNSGINYGLCFSLPSNVNSSGDTRFHSSGTRFDSDCPKFVIRYRDMKGIEPYWSYSSQNIGYAGTGYVNHATGKLSLVKNLTASADSLMPYTVSFTYNSAIANGYYISDNAETPYKEPHAGYGFKLNIYESIMPVLLANDTKKYYVWSDGDGTEHYFIPTSDSNKFIDEDGLNLTLEVSDDCYKITDSDKNVKKFIRKNSDSYINECGILSEISDSLENKIIFTYNSKNEVTSIGVKPNAYSTPITQIKLSYYSSGQINRIVNYGTKEGYTFLQSQTYNGSIGQYGSGYLRRISRSYQTSDISSDAWDSFLSGSSPTGIVSETIAEYTYDSAGNMISAKDCDSGYTLNYSYSYGKISDIQEYAGSLDGQKIGITYNEGYTEVRSSGNDDIYGNDDDIFTRYSFDYEGRVKSTYSRDRNYSKIYGAYSGKYETVEKAKNKIKESVTMGEPAVNYILNGGFEEGTDSSFTHWEKTGNVRRSKNTEANGNLYKAVFSLHSNTTDKIYQYVYIPAGEFTLSFDVSSMNCKNVNAYIKAESIDSPGHNFVEKFQLDGNNINGGTSFASMTFTANQVTHFGEKFKITIEIETKSLPSYGSEESLVTIDSVMLSRGIGVNKYSLVQYGNFDDLEIDSSGTLQNNIGNYWKDQNGNAISTGFGDSILVLNGSVENELYAKQTIYKASDADIAAYDRGTDLVLNSYTYIVSGFGQAYYANPNPDARFGLRVEVKYYNSGGTDYVETYTYDFEKDCTNKQFVCGSFTTLENRLVHEINIYCDFSHQSSVTGLFENISVVCADADKVVKRTYYENNGLLATEGTGTWNTTYYEYDDQNRLTRVANNKGELTDYEYTGDSRNASKETYCTFVRNNVSSIVKIRYPFNETNKNITKTPKTITQNSYNSFGQLIKSETSDTSTGKKITTLCTYNNESGSYIFGALLSESDGMNRTTNYFYDSKNGQMTACINNDGTGLCYEYDCKGRIKGVYPATMTESSYTKESNTEKAVYNFSDGTLKGITTSSTAYTFSNDSFGNTLSAKAGSNTLASYSYNSNNGKLKKITYGNGFVVRYVYDDIDNISQVWYTEKNSSEYLAYEYKYTSNGQLAKVTDHIIGKCHIYKYNTNGQLTECRQYDLSSLTEENGQIVFYDEYSRLTSGFYSFGYLYDANKTSSYGYNYHNSYNDDGTLKEYRLSGNNNVSFNETYTYDKLGRTTKTVYAGVAGETGFNREISYGYEESGNQTSGRVTSYSSKVNNTTITFEYTYDLKGNITLIKCGSDQIRYSYDNLGQLIREDNNIIGKTYLWTYDNAGNILTEKTYEYTLGTPGTALKTNTYTYGTSSWKDLLTKYNGESITYDTIGNPLSYYNGSSYTFTWKNGRKLSTAVKGSNSLSFKYNDSGIRTSKTVNGVEHKYTLQGNLILSEVWGNNQIIYLYDSAGSPIGMQYRTASMSEDSFYTYWFDKSLQGDIVAVYNENGTKLISYSYDAWGNFLTTNHNISGTNAYANYNPFKYRGYYYDTETGFYYVSSRYYDPEIGRWINADDIDYLGADGSPLSYNLFAYCMNNPVNRFDVNGNWSLPNWAKIAIGAAAIAVGVGVTVLTGGAALPALIAGVKAACVAGAISAGTSAATTAVRSVVSGDSFSTVVQKSAKAAVDGFADGFMAGGIAAGASQVASGGFKIATKLGAKTGKSGGIKLGNTKILSPDAAWQKNNGGTLLKVGETFRIDVGSNTLLHMHIPKVSSHIQIGTIGAGIYGGLR